MVNLHSPLALQMPAAGGAALASRSKYWRIPISLWSMNAISRIWDEHAVVRVARYGVHTNLTSTLLLLPSDSLARAFFSRTTEIMVREYTYTHLQLCTRESNVKGILICFLIRYTRIDCILQNNSLTFCIDRSLNGVHEGDYGFQYICGATSFYCDRKEWFNRVQLVLFSADCAIIMYTSKTSIVDLLSWWWYGLNIMLFLWILMTVKKQEAITFWPTICTGEPRIVERVDTILALELV